MNPAILEISSLAIKRSKDFCLLVDSLRIEPGQIACLVGANGSGKSTLIEAIAGSIHSPGSISICGMPQGQVGGEANRAVGYVPDDDTWIVPELTAREYLCLLETVRTTSGCFAIPTAAAELAERLSFTSLDTQMRMLSHGNRKKVQIIAATYHRPRLLIVDELRNGLDPLAIRLAERIIGELADSGSAILASTHDLRWAEKVADRAIMLRAGSIILDESMPVLREPGRSLETELLRRYGEGAHA